MSTNQFWAWIGQIVVAGGGGALIAFGIFSLLVKHWIETLFNKNLEAYKTVQNQELEKYKVQINALFGRITKIHEKEFEVLPLAWYKFQLALGKVGVVASIYKEYSDLEYLDEIQLNEVLDRHKFSVSDKQKIINSFPKDRNQKYQELVFWEELQQAFDAVYDFHNYLLFNKIFLSLDLFTAFNGLDTRLISIVNDLKYGKADKMHEISIKGMQKFRELDKDESIVDLERLVQKRLHYDEASNI